MYNHDHDNEVIVFAETDFRNQRQKFGIKTDDRRRHTYILGKSGAGKTTFLQGFAKGLGVKEKILSPTFILMKKFKILNTSKCGQYSPGFYRVCVDFEVY